MRIFPTPDQGLALAEFGEEQGEAGIRRVSFDLTNARTREPQEVSGNFLWAITATDGATNVDISFARATFDEGMTFKSGTRISGLRFSRIFLTHPAQAGKSITLVYATERAGGLRIDNPAGDFSAVSLTIPGASTMLADATLAINTDVVAFAAVTTRRRLIVEADIDNTEDLRCGPGTLLDATGMKLTPGAQQDFFTTQAINVRNPNTNTNTQTWRAYEERD